MATRQEIVGTILHLRNLGYILHNYDENIFMQKMTKEKGEEIHTIRIFWDPTGLEPIFQFDKPQKKGECR